MRRHHPVTQGRRVVYGLALLLMRSTSYVHAGHRCVRVAGRLLRVCQVAGNGVASPLSCARSSGYASATAELMQPGTDEQSFVYKVRDHGDRAGPRKRLPPRTCRTRHRLDPSASAEPGCHQREDGHNRLPTTEREEG